MVIFVVKLIFAWNTTHIIMLFAQAFKLFHSIDNQQKRKFKKFLKSSFFTQQSALLRLFRYLDNLPEKKGETDLQKGLFFLIYPEERKKSKLDPRQQKKKLSNTLSDFGLAIQEFIAASKLQKDPLQQYYYLTDFFATGNDPQLFLKTMNKYNRLIHKEKNGFKKHLAKFWYHRNLFTFRHTDEKKETSSIILKKMMQELDLAYLFAKLTLVCNAVYRSTMLNEHVSEEDIRVILDLTKPYANENHPEILLYYTMIELARLPEDRSRLREAFRLLKKCCDQLSREENRELSAYLTNYCIRQFALGSTEYLSEKFEIDVWAITSGVVLGEKETLQDTDYLNIALTGLAIPNQIEHSKTFMDIFIHRLPEDRQEMAKALAYSYYYFQTDQFALAERELRKLSIKEFHYTIRIRSLQVRLEYELFLSGKSDPERAFKAISSFEKYIARNLINLEEKRKVGYLRLAWFIRKMTEYRNDKSSNKKFVKNKLCAELADNPPVVADWVKRKITELR